MLPKSRQAPCGPHLHGMHNPPSQDTRSCWVAGVAVSIILYLFNNFQGLTTLASSALGMDNKRLSKQPGFWRASYLQSGDERRPMVVGVSSPTMCNALNGWFRGG
ncbi:hypothetical protein PpBr36_00473 [Pyricularia pennisetigena]|uniref:hypothetical protein n=1 Tax=Pyricularia pennisetigena TaxID=1578925 RepID=UPI00114FB106|nr:hypothetical protein PpBr36_00473 [Pyricularia pennisetigena]TLS29683.1 hypothetical protein PpBr36_00473 [Pyricularia pennisetigena]